ncbi:enoyl-[acyl-carrier-protein] reductase FabK [Candidatus Desantisbacteria bacterium]|nr:enoyl-[acyl-carrier-protein] reductase FabK [Candidatus Desantisbacteria bacterium]
MIHTEICDLFNIKYPVIQGGMAWISMHQLVAAVSNAGGLGIIASGFMDIELLRQEIRETRKLTSMPFGVNLMLMSTAIEEMVKVVIEEKIPVVTTGAGNPGKYLSLFKQAGIKVVPVVASVALARRMEKQGVDAIIAEGMESGGHIGESTTMTIVPQVVDAVKIPVIAAGGIADGRGLAAAFALGARGVQIGTRFAATSECPIHDNFKNAIIKADDRATCITGRSTGHPVRIIKNNLSRQFEKLEQENASAEALENLGKGRLRMAAREGNVNEGSVMCGQIAGLIKEILPVKDVMEKLITEAEKTLDRIYKIKGQ